MKIFLPWILCIIANYYCIRNKLCIPLFLDLSSPSKYCAENSSISFGWDLRTSRAKPSSASSSPLGILSRIKSGRSAILRTTVTLLKSFNQQQLSLYTKQIPAFESCMLGPRPGTSSYVVLQAMACFSWTDSLITHVQLHL